MVDLHTHSNCSDGSNTPQSLVRGADDAGVRRLALTDHDTVVGVSAAVAEARARGMHLIAGVELAVEHGKRHAHLLGLGFAAGIQGDRLDEFLRSVQERRVDRNLAMVKRMQDDGLRVAYADIEAEAGGGSIGRPHMASLLVKRGVARNVAEAFDRFLGRGCPYHVPRETTTLEAAAHAIRSAGGHAVVAHPSARDAAALEQLVVDVRAAGVTGIEAFHPALSKEVSSLLLKLANKHDLFVTGGSDFHGERTPDRRLGHWLSDVPVPGFAGAELADATAADTHTRRDLPAGA